MAYDARAYWADRAAMEFDPLVRLDRETILRKRKRLAVDRVERDAETIAAIDAACERLLAWRASGDPEPLPPRRKKDPAPEPETVEADPAAPDPVQAARLATEAARVRMLARQQDRHQRRRSAYPDVRPLMPD